MRKKSVEREELKLKDNSLTEQENLEHGAVEQSEDENYDGVIDLTVTRKKRFHVNRGSGHDDVLELDTSDMNIITRLDKLYPRLQNLSQEASLQQLNAESASTEEALEKISQALIKIDIQMRQILDEIFDAPVAEKCAPSGSMFDPFNGEFRYEHILDVITKLYENNINSEFKKMSDRIRSKTANKRPKGR